MNRDEIMNMQPGRELDRLVSELVGYITYEDFPVHAIYTGDTPTSFKVFQPSLFIGASFDVVEKMREKKRMFTLSHKLNSLGEIFAYKASFFTYQGEGRDCTNTSEKAPQAISIAAILSLIQEDTP